MEFYQSILHVNAACYNIWSHCVMRHSDGYADDTCCRIVQVTASCDISQLSVDSTSPFILIEICETCWRFHGVVTEKNGKHHGSQRWKHDWKKFSVFLLLPSRKTVGPVPKNHNFVMCRHAGKRRGCTYRYHSGRQCKFAHSSEEIEVWKWMLNNDGNRLLHCLLGF